MKRIWIALLLILALLTGCAAKTEMDEKTGITFTDHTGAVVTVPEKPEKVAVLLSSLADLWITAGGEVAITVGETVDRGFVSEDVILVDDGAGKTVDLETLIAQKPDFVLYACDLSAQLGCAPALKAAGIPAAGFRVETFGDYLELLELCTEILGTPERYKTYGTDLREEIREILDADREEAGTPKILFVRAGSSARYTKAKTAENHFVCGMLKELGAENIAEKAPVLLDGLSMEEILLCDPDAIFFTTMGEERAGVAYMDSLLSDPVWKELSAVKSGRVYALPKDLFQYKPNARWPEAYQYLENLLYGDGL